MKPLIRRFRPALAADILLASAALLYAAGLLLLFSLGSEGLQSHFGSFVGGQDVEAGKLTGGLLDGIHARSLPWGLLFAALGAALLLLRPVSRAVRSGWSLSGEWSSFDALVRDPLKEKRGLSVVLGLTAVALVFRLLYIDRAIRYDEAYTWLSFVRRSPLIGLSYYSAPNNHLFHTFLAHLTTRIFGNTPAALRLPALLSSLAVVPLLVSLGRSMGYRKAGAAAALLWAVSPMAVSYSVNARGYTLTVLIFLLLTAAALEWAGSGGFSGRPPILLMSLAGAAGMYTVPTFIIPLAGIGLFLFALTGRKGEKRKQLGTIILLTALITLVLYSPVFVVSGLSSVVSNRFVVPGTLSSLAASLPALPGMLAGQWRPAGPDVLALPFALLAAAGLLLFLIRRKERAFPLFIAAQVLAMLLFLLLQRRVPYLRVYIYLLPLYYFSGAVALMSVSGKRVLAVVLLLLVFSGGAYEIGRGTVYADSDTGYLPEADKLAASLEVLLDEESAVSLKYTPILEYYAGVYGYRRLESALTLDRSKARRVFVILDNAVPTGPENLLRDDGFDPALFGQAAVPVDGQGIRVEEWERRR